MEPISAQRMVARINAKVENKAKQTWTDTEVLAAIDKAVERLVLLQSQSFRDQELDYVDLTIATEKTPALTMALVGDILVWRLPEYIRKVRRIEDTSNGTFPIEIPHLKLEEKDQYRNPNVGRLRKYWIYMQGNEHRGRIGFTGGLTGVSTIRVWYERRVAPLHFGVARVGVVGVNPAGSTSARIWFADPSSGSTAGRILSRGITYGTGASAVSVNQVYIGAQVEFGNSNSGTFVEGVTDQIRRLVGSVYGRVNDPGTDDWQWVFDEVLQRPGDGALLTCAQFSYSLIPQIEPEHHPLVEVVAAMLLAQESGSKRMVDSLREQHEVGITQFQQACSDRQNQTFDQVRYYDMD